MTPMIGLAIVLVLAAIVVALMRIRKHLGTEGAVSEWTHRVCENCYSIEEPGPTFSPEWTPTPTGPPAPPPWKPPGRKSGCVSFSLSSVALIGGAFAAWRRRIRSS